MPMITGQQLDRFALMIWNWAGVFLPRLLAAIGILVAGFAIARWLARLARNVLLGAAHVDPALKPIIVNVVRYALVALTVIATLDQLGFQTTSLLAVLGAAGLAIGLALQGTLSNIAAGIMLLWLRPFQIGDYIEVGGQGGTVQEIGLFGCRLCTFDGIFLFLPNSSIWNAPLRNHTRNGGRLISIDVTLPANADLARARTALIGAAKGAEGSLCVPPPRVFVEALSPNGLVLGLLLWSKPQGAGAVERSVIEAIKRSLDALGDALKPVQITRTIPPDADPSRYLEERTPLPL